MFRPVLHIRIAGFTIHAFQFFGVVGFVLGNILGVLLASMLGLNAGIVVLLGVLGAGVFFGLTYMTKWITGEEMIVYYHHEISIVLLATLTLWLLRLPILPYIDIVILGIATFLAFGRIGCYSVGCCHGRPHRFGVRYGRKHVEAGFTWYYRDIKLFPIQLLESVTVTLAIITGVILLYKQVVPGTILIFYTISYGMFRYTFEFFRGDPERPVYLGLSEAQWTSLCLAVFTFILSRIGWLPYYTWHFYLLILMLATSLIVMIFFKTRGVLLSPPHIKELARGLDVLDDEGDIPGYAERPVTIYTTKAGLCLSHGSYKLNDREVKHYTISLKKGSVLRKRAAEKTAELISRLRTHLGKADIIEKDHGVYHILFQDHLYRKGIES